LIVIQRVQIKSINQPLHHIRTKNKTCATAKAAEKTLKASINLCSMAERKQDMQCCTSSRKSNKESQYVEVNLEREGPSTKNIKNKQSCQQQKDNNEPCVD